jgi:ribonucleoside-diphosphate reductase beta chain
MINAIKEEQPELWTPEFQQHVIDLVKRAVVLEYTFAQTVFPKGIFGMNADGFKQYSREGLRTGSKKIQILELIFCFEGSCYLQLHKSLGTNELSHLEKNQLYLTLLKICK